jgi:hypothetical protein
MARSRSLITQIDEQLTWGEHHQREAADPLLFHRVECARSEGQAVLTLLQSLSASGGTPLTDQQHRHRSVAMEAGI